MAGRIAYYGNIIKDGLILNLDAAKRDSYPGSGTVWRDISGNNYNGTLLNGTSYNSTNYGVIRFNGGAGSFVNITTNANLPLLSQDGQSFSISCWVKGQMLNELGSRALIGQDWGSTGSGWNGLYFDWTIGSSFRTRMVVGNNITSNEISTLNTLSVDSFKMFTGVYNGSSITIYVNGIFVVSGSTNIIPKLNDPDKSWVVGGNYERIITNNSGFLIGDISSVQFYNRALSSQEILQNYNATKGRFSITDIVTNPINWDDSSLWNDSENWSEPNGI